MLSWPRSRKYSEHFLEIPKSTNPLLAEHISPPRQIAYYSHFPEATVDDYRYQSSDALKLFNPPSGSFKITGAISKPDFSKMCDRVDPLLRQDLLVQRIQPVVTSCERANRYEEIENADIITRRGVMVDLAMGKKAKYDVFCVDKKLHISRKAFTLRDDIPHDGPYYGHCFEELCTGSAPQGPHSTFFSVVQRNIGKLNVIMSGEVDCSKSTDGEPRLEDYIELKTVKAPKNKLPRHIKELLPRWYLQSYLSGVPQLAIGYRDSTDRVVTFEQKSIDEVLQYVKEHVPTFDPAVCLGRVYAILSRLRKHIHSLGDAVSAEDKFQLRVNANGVVYVTPPANL